MSEPGTLRIWAHRLINVASHIVFDRVLQRTTFRNRYLISDEAIDQDVDYVLRIARGYLDQLRGLGVDVRGSRVLELGPGHNCGSLLYLACLGAHVIVADAFFTEWDARYHPRFYRRLAARIRTEESDTDTAVLERQAAATDYLSDVLRIVRQPVEGLADLADASVDVVLSNAVLEHLRDHAAGLRELARISRPGAVGAHQVDFRNHEHFERPLEFLLLSQERGQRIRHEFSGSRLRRSDYDALWSAAGFSVLDFRPGELASEVYLADFLPRLRDAKDSPYKDRAEGELRVLGGLFLVRRGGTP